MEGWGRLGWNRSIWLEAEVVIQGPLKARLLHALRGDLDQYPAGYSIHLKGSGTFSKIEWQVESPYLTLTVATHS